MKKVNLDEVDFRFLDSASSSSEIEAVCLYEYMRESQMLRDALNSKTDDERRRKGPPYGLKTPFFLSFTEERLVFLVLALGRAGFPKPWNVLSDKSRKRLSSLLVKSTQRARRGDKELHPPVIIEQGVVEFAPCLETPDRWHHWRLEAPKPSLLKSWERSGRCYFYGIIRVDLGYNETEASEAFRNEFEKHWGKTRGGGGPDWRARLTQLAVMRIWKYESEQWKRLKLVAEFCGYKGCKREAAEHKVRGYRGHAKEPMSEAAKVEMSKSRTEARTFFQSLFPGEEPLSYRLSEKEKS